MTDNAPPLARRQFLKQSALATAGLSAVPQAFALGRVLGANDRIRMGFIGVGNRGSQLLTRFMANQDVTVAALCDVYTPYTTRDASQVDARWRASGRTPGMGESLPADLKRYGDFRELLARDDIDAVCIATPDHWHAVMAIQAIQAGKDVYVEKPLTRTVREGRALVDAQRASDRVVAVGLNRRGASVYQRLAEEIQAGKIGKVVAARAYRISNMIPQGIGRLRPERPPADFNWDLWLGPRAIRPYQYNIAPYYFRWWQDYSSQMGNWGVHYMDAIRWLAAETAPVAVSAHGVSGLINDDRTIPDNLEVTFECASGMLIQFHVYEACGGTGLEGGEIELSGTKGTLVASQNGYTVTPAKPGQFQTWKRLMDPLSYDVQGDAAYGDLAIKEDSTARLIRNFLDCVKSRQQPWCTLEEGHRSTSFAHLANIAAAVKQRILWDPVTERVTNCDAANELLHYEYRRPWHL